MTILTLSLYIGIAALIFTLFVVFYLKREKSLFTSFLQSFTGFLFIFSGWVKVIDSMGTAFKMEQYFAEFESVFTGTWFSFIAPLFPFLSGFSVSFAVLMIIFEIVLGLMLVLGIKPKFTAWAFLLLVAFFTVLTGFTYLTGYVPAGVNFFNFGGWEAYKASNMKVTDCGCFGDFIKLEPKVSFYKDVILLIPAIWFILRYKEMHTLVSAKVAKWTPPVATLLLLGYALYNFVIDEPHIDFRPFRIGTNVAAVKQAEDDAASAVQITHFLMKEIATGNLVEVPYADYMKEYATTYSKDKFEVVEQIKTEPAIPRTKVSEFEIKSFDGDDVSYYYLDNEKFHFMIMSPKASYKTMNMDVTVKDTIFNIDTVWVEGQEDPSILKSVSEIVDKNVTKTDYLWENAYLSDFTDRLKPFMEAALNDGHEVSIVIGGLAADAAADFKSKLGMEVEVYTADDILLKTIMRSNPGVVLWKSGVLVNKWHKRQLPAFEKVKAAHLK